MIHLDPRRIAGRVAFGVVSGFRGHHAIVPPIDYGFHHFDGGYIPNHSFPLITFSVKARLYQLMELLQIIYAHTPGRGLHDHHFLTSPHREW